MFEEICAKVIPDDPSETTLGLLKGMRAAVSDFLIPFLCSSEVPLGTPLNRGTRFDPFFFGCSSFCSVPAGNGGGGGASSVGSGRGGGPLRIEEISLPRV